MKAIILDMYGVVVRQTGDDFAPYVQQSFPQLTEEAIHAVWFRADRGEIPSLEVWRQLGYTGDLARIERGYLDTIELMEGVLPFLDEARSRGYRTALLSNDSSEWSRYLREKFDLNRRFDAVCVSGGLGFGKPGPRSFALAMERLGCAPRDCLFADDRAHNVEAAAALGLRAVHFGALLSHEGRESAADFGQLAALLGWSRA